jgi:pilus assembly protein FimV
VRQEAAKPAAPPPEPAVKEQPKADLPKPVLGEASEKGVAAEPPPPPAPKKAVVAPPPAPMPPAGGSDTASNQGLLLGGAALALLAGIGGLWAWRRRSAEPAAEFTSTEPALHPLTPARQATVAVAVPAAARASASAAVATETHDITQPGPTVASVTDSVDPIDEAKVHLEYGQRERAETILREALSKQPGREDIQLLLLESLAVRGDTDGFNQLAGRVHKQTGGLGDHWKQVMSMGYALDPGYPLYSPTDEAPAPDSFNGAADLRLDDDNAGADMDKTLVLVRPGARPAAPAPAIAPLPDMNFELPPANAPSAQAIPEIALAPVRVPDLPGLDFKVDLPGIALPPDEVAGTGAASADSELQHEEVQKKIMLARAYREMGDKEGALELLREVEREGDSTQLAEMRELLQTLA